jgi:hypothetical protein
MKINAAALTPRSVKPLAWAAGAVLVLAGTVQATGAGIDLLALAVLCLILFAFERSVGDWVAEIAGPIGGAVIFAALGLGLSWYFLASSTGRAQTDRFFLEAEKRGYSTIYYEARLDAEGANASASKPVPPEDPKQANGGSQAQPPTDSDSDAQKAVATGATAEAANAAAKTANEAKGRVSEFARSFFPRDPNAPPASTTIVLTISPTKLEIPYQATLKAIVRSAGAPVGFGNVDFTANGLGAGRIRLANDGSATTIFVPRLAGSYEFRARFTGSQEHAASISAPLVVQAVIPK